jgi:hypothetical protein
MVPVSMPEGVPRRSALALGIDPLRMDPCSQWSALAELMHSPMVSAANATRPMGTMRELSQEQNTRRLFGTPRRDATTPCAYSEFHHSHRRDHAVLAEKNRTAVQGAVRLTFGGDEHDSTGRNIVRARRNKRNDRYIGGDVDFLFAAFIGHCHSLTVHALNGVSVRRICHHA